MDYGYHIGAPRSYLLNGELFMATPARNEFSNYMIGYMGYRAAGELGYAFARLGGHLGALSDYGRRDDAGSIEMLRRGGRDAQSDRFMEECVLPALNFVLRHPRILRPLIR